MSTEYETVYKPGRREAHVVPVDDIIKHELSTECACGPEVTPIESDQIEGESLVGHRSLDGREVDSPLGVDG